MKIDKAHIKTFPVMNADGREKRKLLVIGRAQKLQVFRKNKINISNLHITYQFNKKARIMSGLWYDFLCTLNEEIRIKRRNITLLSDNCLSYPHPNSLPENYEGSTPPFLTNKTLIYLSLNTTSHLQPLDQGIIVSFMSVYCQQYANFIVRYLNTNYQSPPNLDILSAIYLIADTWEAIPASKIKKFWKRSGLIGAAFPLSINPILHN